MTNIGSHCILELYDCPVGLLNDATFVRKALREAVEASGATLLHEVAHAFEPQGVTALGLLSESHISIHTWPELGYLGADIFTCGSVAVPERACEHLALAFQARRHKMRKLPRGPRSRRPAPHHAQSPCLAAVQGATA
jgi:S-adenosylmethionine decarboxylase